MGRNDQQGRNRCLFFVEVQVEGIMADGLEEELDIIDGIPIEAGEDDGIIAELAEALDIDAGAGEEDGGIHIRNLEADADGHELIQIIVFALHGAEAENGGTGDGDALGELIHRAAALHDIGEGPMKGGRKLTFKL